MFSSTLSRKRSSTWLPLLMVEAKNDPGFMVGVERVCFGKEEGRESLATIRPCLNEAVGYIYKGRGISSTLGFSK